MLTKSCEMLVDLTPEEVWNRIFSDEGAKRMHPEGDYVKIIKPFDEMKVGAEMKIRGKGLDFYRRSTTIITDFQPPVRYAMETKNFGFKFFREEHDFWPHGDTQTLVRTTFIFELHWKDGWDDKNWIPPGINDLLIWWQEAILRAITLDAETPG